MPTNHRFNTEGHSPAAVLLVGVIELGLNLELYSTKKLDSGNLENLVPRKQSAIRYRYFFVPFLSCPFFFFFLLFMELSNFRLFLVLISTSSCQIHAVVSVSLHAKIE